VIKQEAQQAAEEGIAPQGHAEGIQFRETVHPFREGKSCEKLVVRSGNETRLLFGLQETCQKLGIKNDSKSGRKRDRDTDLQNGRCVCVGGGGGGKSGKEGEVRWTCGSTSVLSSMIRLLNKLSLSVPTSHQEAVEERQRCRRVPIVLAAF
jgi:hypothetical protein